MVGMGLVELLGRGKRLRVRARNCCGAIHFGAAQRDPTEALQRRTFPAETSLFRAKYDI